MDGIPILLDKSALEMLSADELNALSRHYFLVVPPILITEIVGDLYSKRRDSTQDGVQTDLVQKVANKIVTNAACRNVDYRDIRAADLLGDEVDHGGFRPILTATRTAFDDDGTEMALIVQDVEMELILNWQKGDFSVEDETYAKLWKATSPADLDEYRRQLKEAKFEIEASNLADIRSQLDSQFKSANQGDLLIYSCSRAKFSPEETLVVRGRWDRLGRPRFCDFAPYAYFCILVEMVFAYGLAKDLIRTSKKAKSDVDLQYVFYFPFTRVFGSRDTFHSELWDVFGNVQKQSFVWGDDLKADLKAIHEYWRDASEDECATLRQSAPHPPLRESSYSVGLFEKMVALGRLSSREDTIQYSQRKRTPEEDKAIVEGVLARYNKLKAKQSPH
jgi:hypothetical protein